MSRLAIDLTPLQHAVAVGDVLSAIGEAGRVVALLQVELTRRSLPAQPATPPAEYLDTAGAMALCHCSARTLRRRMRDGTWQEGMHWHRPPGSEPRYVRAALVAWLASPIVDSPSAVGLAYGYDVPPPPRRRRSRLNLLGTNR
jgi:hypothetical protein